MMKETIIQTRVERHIIKSSDEYFSIKALRSALSAS